MPSSTPNLSEPDALRATWERRLLARARMGSRPAINTLADWYSAWLRRWARGRLPRWSRGAVDTSDVVQDALSRTFARLARFEPAHAGALRAYLRRAVENRIRDQLRRAAHRQTVDAEELPERDSQAGAPQLRQLMDEEAWARYLDGLQRLSPRDRRLIVGRVELGYNYRQLAFIERIPSADAARKAVRRALVRLSGEMPHA
ncbi:MAG: RNA polymerase sigma factor [Acidobacteria bacterium]|nr:RNA polymerase sigma factor [Acidobacteriota bacterium]